MIDRYRVREATIADVATLSRHRITMFEDMGVPLDRDELDRGFREWLAQTMTTGDYRAWLVEDSDGSIVAGGGITILPWPPGPRYPGGRLAFVYNVYTEPGHRRRGVARLVMDTIHDWCRDADVLSLALNASLDGQPLYESMGYVVTPSPMMFRRLTSEKK